MQQLKPELNMSEFEAGEELAPDIIPEKSEEQIEEKFKYKYNKTFIRLMNRDPDWLYTYWEVNKPEYYSCRPLLRLFSEGEGTYCDIEINHSSDNWYLSPVKGDHTYRVAIGYMKDGIFHPLGYSNPVTTPADRPSDIVDQKWMSIEELTTSYYLEINATLGFVKSLEERKKREGINVDSYSFIKDQI